MNLERVLHIAEIANRLVETEGYDEEQALEIACLDRSWSELEEA